MKLSLMFLAICLMAGTFGQNIFYWPHPATSAGRSGAGLYWPRSFYRGSAGLYERYVDQPESSIDGAAYNHDGSEEEEVLGRNKIRNFWGKDKSSRVDKLRLLNQVKTVTSPVVVYSTTATLTQTVVNNCIPTSQFSSSVGAVDNKPTTFTTACQRRKREHPLIFDSAIDATSNINWIEATQLNDDVMVERDRRDVESSRYPLNSDQDDDYGSVSPRFAFSLINNLSNLFASTSTLVVTVNLDTSYTLQTTTAPRTVKVLPDGAAVKLTCLPPGYAVCSP